MMSLKKIRRRLRKSSTKITIKMTIMKTNMKRITIAIIKATTKNVIIINKTKMKTGFGNTMTKIMP